MYVRIYIKKNKKLGGGGCDENVKSLKFLGRGLDFFDFFLVLCMYWINLYNIDNNFIFILIYRDFFYIFGLLNEVEK